MKRIKVPSGSIQKLETVFDELQTNVQENLVGHTNLWLESGGIDLKVMNSVIDSASSAFKVDLATTAEHPTRLTINKGTAIFPNGEVSTISSSYDFEPTSLQPDSYYLIVCKQIELGASPIPSQTAFLFDTSGNTPYSTKNTKFTNSFEIATYLITDTTYSELPIDDRRINVAIVKTGTVGQSYQWATGWAGTDGEASVEGVIDLRAHNTRRINENILDDSKILFKDRDSIGANKIQGGIEASGAIIGGTLQSNGSLSVSGVSTLEGALNVIEDSTDLSVTFSAHGTNYLKLANLTSPRSCIIATDSNPFAVAISGQLLSDASFNISAAGKTALGPAAGASNASQTLEIIDQGQDINSGVRLSALSLTNANAKNTVFDIYAVNNDSGSGAGKLVIAPIEEDRFTDFQSTSGVSVLQINPTNNQIIVGTNNSNIGTSSALYVKGNTYISGSIVSLGANSVFSNSEFNRNGAGDNAITIKGSSSFEPYATGEATTLSVAAGVPVSLGDSLNVSSTLDVTSDSTFSDIYISGGVKTSLNIDGDLSSTGHTTSSGNTNVLGALTVSGNTTLGASASNSISLIGTIDTLSANQISVAEYLYAQNSETHLGVIKWKGGANDTTRVAGVSADGSMTIGDNQNNTMPSDSLRVHDESHSILRLTSPYGSSFIFGDGSSSENFKLTTAPDYSYLNIGANISGTGIQINANNAITMENATVASLAVTDSLDIQTLLTVQTLNASAASIGSVNIDGNSLEVLGTLTATDSAAFIDDLHVSGISTDDDGSNLIIRGTSSEEFRVGVGGSVAAGKLVKLVEDGFTTPSFFRIYDFGPSPDKSSNMAYISFKWNFDNLNIATNFDDGNGPDLKKVQINGSYDALEDTLIFSGLSQAAVAGKSLRFSSGNQYAIDTYTSATISGTPVHYLTLNEDIDTSADGPSSSSPPRIIDTNCRGYKIKITKTDNDGNATPERNTYDLDSDYIYHPTFITSLQTGGKYRFELKPYNNDTDGNWAAMSASSYDPDHDGNGAQTPIAYGFPFVADLPALGDPGTLTLEGTAFGFNINIAGWESTTDTDQTAHEWEVIYGTSSGINFADFTNTTHITTANRLIPINANVPSRFYVSARPLQNKNVVGTPISANVIAGGGGIPPTDSLLAGPTDFSVIVHSGVITQCYSGMNAYDIETQEVETGGASLIFSNGTLTGKTISFPSLVGGSDFQILNNYLTEDNDPIGTQNPAS